MRRSDFAYHLPPELIAQEPRERGKSRMMVVRQEGIEHDSFANFPSRLKPGDVLVLNDTRVIPARLFARRAGMTRPVEILLTREMWSAAAMPPLSDGTAAARPPHSTWEAWAKPAKRLKAGDELTFSENLRARIEDRREGTVVLQFD